MISALLFFVLILAFPVQQPIDPALKALVDRFFTTQVEEDIAGYMALWSRTAKRPQADQLKFIFDSGDDRFYDLEITHASISGDDAHVRGAVTRLRTAFNSPGSSGTPQRSNVRMHFSLSFVREEGEWKLVREGSPIEELAALLIDTADPAARRTLLKAEPDVVNSRLVDAIARQADNLGRQQQYARALAVYERALEVARTIGDRKAEGHMLQNVANSYYFLRDFPAALAGYEKRLALERDSGNDEGRASALVGIATIHYSTYEYTRALALYREALEIQERLKEEALVATTLISTANVLYLQGDFDGAIADYKRAEVLKRKYFDLDGAAAALEGLGRSLAAQGDYAAALVAFSRGVEDARRRRDVRREATALQHAGDTHFHLANLDAARVAFDESRRRYEKTGDLANAGRVWQAAAVTELLSGRVTHAETAYGKSMEACTAAKPKSDAECIARALVGLGFTQASQERYDEAIATYRKSIAAFEALKAAEGAGRARVGLAEAFTGSGRYEDALKVAVEARLAAGAIDSDDLLWRALVSEARAERKLGRDKAALGHARAAVLAVRRLAAAALERPAHAAPRDTPTAYATAAILFAEAGDAPAAWALVEDMRTHALRTAMAPNERDVARGMTDEERAAERKAAAELTALIVQRDRERNLPRPSAPRLAKLDAAIKEAAAKRSAFQGGLFKKLPALRAWRGLSPPAQLDEIEKQVEPGTLLLQFILDERDLLVLTAERTEGQVQWGAHAASTRRHAIAETIRRALDPAVLADPARWRAASSELLKQFPSSLTPLLARARRLIVIPHDVLWRVPFEALPTESGYIADRATVTLVPSVTAVVRTTAGTSQAEMHVAAVAAPMLPPDLVETLRTTAPAWVLRDGSSSQREVETLRTALPDGMTVLTGQEATEAAVRSAGANASALHVAAPFRVNAANPMFSSVLLARDELPDAARAVDGILEAREIANAEFGTRIALFTDPAALSMLDAAATVPVFQWVLRAGGIETLILRRWGSDDAAAAGLLAKFYEQLRQGRSPADALQAARDASRQAGAPPQVWAGWLLLESSVASRQSSGKVANHRSSVE